MVPSKNTYFWKTFRTIPVSTGQYTLSVVYVKIQVPKSLSLPLSGKNHLSCFQRIQTELKEKKSKSGEKNVLR